jgi:DNA-binding response OmpR family regulator
VFPVTPPHLREILNGLNWKVHEAHDACDVVQFFSTRRVPVILCHCAFASGSWKDILDYISVLPCPPQLIVTSEAADPFLWAEVLNLGGYDVVAQPFREPEVERTLSSALRRWEEETAHAGA